jgi:hypothetical protein
MEEPDRPQRTTWRIRITCWITTATHTHTHTQYLIIIALALQQRLVVTFARTVPACSICRERGRL